MRWPRLYRGKWRSEKHLLNVVRTRVSASWSHQREMLWDASTAAHSSFICLPSVDHEARKFELSSYFVLFSFQFPKLRSAWMSLRTFAGRHENGRKRTGAALHLHRAPNPQVSGKDWRAAFGSHRCSHQGAQIVFGRVDEQAKRRAFVGGLSRRRKSRRAG